MAGKRRWNRLPARFSDALNGISGVAGLGGTAMALAGFTALTGAAATALMTGGIAVTLSATGYALYKAIPPQMRTQQAVAGETLELADLEDVDPPLLLLAIVGPTKAGKTTLKNRLSFKEKADGRTQRITAYVVSVPATPPKYLAILDGGGEQFAQQFRISEPADCLCLVLDHTISDTATDVDNARLKDHADFLTQIRYHLKDAKCKPKKWIEILVNKRDLWEKAAEDQKQAFQQFYTNEMEKWTEGAFAETTRSTPHSNEIADDVARFMSQLVDTVTK